MKGRQVVTSVVVLGLLVGLAGVTLAQGTAPQGAPVGTAFTYQGRLADGSGPVTGTCDFTFRLYDAAGSGSPPAGGTLAGTDAVAGVAVVDGYFTAELDFGAGAFPGEARWLEIEVNCGAGSVILSPRQALTPTPYALWAAGAPWAGLTGVPAGLADGQDADALAGLACDPGEVAVWDGADWVCGRAEGSTHSCGTGLRLSSGRFSLAGTYRLPQTCTDGQVAEWDVTEEVWACAADDDALGGLSCVDGEVAQWDAAGGGWICAADDDSDTTYSAGNQLSLVGTTFDVLEGAGSGLDADLLDGQGGAYYRSWANLTGVPVGFGDGVDHVDDADADPTNELEMPSDCDPGQIVEWDDAGGEWICAEDDDGDTTYSAGNQLNLVGTTFHVLEGAGSGLDADLLDGQHGTDYHDWANLTGVPAGFADGVDNVNDADADPTNELEMPTGCDPEQMAVWDGTAGEWKCADAGVGDITAVNTGVGLSGGATSGDVTLSVNLAGNGAASTVARSDHHHDSRYYTQTNLQGDGTAQVHWSNLTSVPAGFADGVDGDVLGGLSCANGEIAKRIGGAWMCADDDTAAGGSSWLLAGNGGTTPGTDFVGTTDNQALELQVDGQRALRLEPATDAHYGFSPNVIGGYVGNQVTAGKVGATIGGGGAFVAAGPADFANQVTGSFGTVSGGRFNTADLTATVGGGAGNTASGRSATVGGGVANTASGRYATVGGGDENTASELRATVGGGYFNEASGEYATVGGGHLNEASGEHATVPGGYSAKASKYGQLAYASGDFADAGDAQAGFYVLRAETSADTGDRRLFLDGFSKELTIATPRTMAFDILVVARSEDSKSAGYTIKGVVEYDTPPGGKWSVRFVGDPIVATLGEDSSGWDVDIGIDDSSQSLYIEPQHGQVTSRIRWVATVRTSEVAWPAP